MSGSARPCRERHRVAPELGLGGLQRPLLVMNLAAQEPPAPVGRVEAVALG